MNIIILVSGLVILDLHLLVFPTPLCFCLFVLFSCSFIEYKKHYFSKTNLDILSTNLIVF